MIKNKYLYDYEIRKILRSNYMAQRYFMFERSLFSVDNLGEITRVDLVVFFMREYLKYGRRKIVENSTLSDYQVRKSYHKLKGMG
jgi:hypothetical protein